MEPILDISLGALAQLLASHAELAQAEWERNPAFSDSHHSEKGANRVLAELQERLDETTLALLLGQINFYMNHKTEGTA